MIVTLYIRIYAWGRQGGKGDWGPGRLNPSLQLQDLHPVHPEICTMPELRLDTLVREENVKTGGTGVFNPLRISV